MLFVKFYAAGIHGIKHAEKMNNFVLMFGVQRDTEPGPGKMPYGIILTPQGTYKAIIKRVYLGTHKELKDAINAVNDHLKNE